MTFEKLEYLDKMLDYYSKLDIYRTVVKIEFIEMLLIQELLNSQIYNL